MGDHLPSFWLPNRFQGVPFWFDLTSFLADQPENFSKGHLPPIYLILWGSAHRKTQPFDQNVFIACVLKTCSAEIFLKIRVLTVFSERSENQNGRPKERSTKFPNVSKNRPHLEKISAHATAYNSSFLLSLRHKNLILL